MREIRRLSCIIRVTQQKEKEMLRPPFSLIYQIRFSAYSDTGRPMA